VASLLLKRSLLPALLAGIFNGGDDAPLGVLLTLSTLLTMLTLLTLLTF
jgi:hypothetical protein